MLPKLLCIIAIQLLCGLLLFNQVTQTIADSDSDSGWSADSGSSNNEGTKVRSESVKERIKQFLDIMDKLSKLMNSTSTGKEFLRKNDLPMVNSAYRVVDFPDVYEICNKDEPCTCEGQLIKCKKPDCPPKPSNPKRCAGEPICFEDCKAQLVPALVANKSAAHRALDMTSGRSSVDLRSFVKALPKNELSKLADELADTAIDLHNQQESVSSPRSAMLPSNQTVKTDPGKPDWVNPAIKMTSEMRELADQIVQFIKLSTHAAKDIRKAMVCPCHQDQCEAYEASAKTLKACAGICRNNKGCQVWECVCPNKHPQKTIQKTTKKPKATMRPPKCSQSPYKSTTREPKKRTTKGPSKSTTKRPRKRTTKVPSKSDNNSTIASDKNSTIAPSNQSSTTARPKHASSLNKDDDFFNDD